MKKLSSIFLLFLCIQLKAADRREITHTVGEKTPLLRLGITNQKSKFSSAELNASLSYHIIKLPPEVGIKIAGKLFRLDDEKVKAIIEKKIPQSVPLKFFYEWQGYQLLQSSELGWYIKQLNFQNLSSASRRQIFDVLDIVEKDPARWFCCVNSDTFSQKTYKSVENFACASDAMVVYDKKSLCCCDTEEENSAAICGVSAAINCCIPGFLSLLFWSPIPLYVFAGEVGAGLMGWGYYMYRAGGGFVKIEEITKKKQV